MVKETIHGVGRRPRDFYKQIAELKNVIFLDMMEYGLDVVQKAMATATITGTAGFEAAVLGRPVISFGRHNNYNIMPHVFTVSREEDLAHYISIIVNKKFDEAKAKADGARYLRAVIETSFDMGRYNYTDFTDYNSMDATRATDALLQSLAFSH